MTTATTPSAYPVPVEELLPQARQLADELGDALSQTKLRRTLKVGAPKAKELLALLENTKASTVTAPTLTLVLDPEPTTTDAEPDPQDSPPVVDDVPVSLPLVAGDTDPVADVGAVESPAVVVPVRRSRTWPVLLLALPAFVAIWSGWVGLGELTGFGTVHPLPGIWDAFRLNTAITLPIGVETYAAFALRAWLSPAVPPAARRFARVSAIGSLMLGAAGQVAYHLMSAAHVTDAPWWITTAVACLPVAVLGMGAALAHLMHTNHNA